MEDKRMEDEGDEERRRRRKTESRMVAKLQELTAQNIFRAQKAKEVEERHKPDAIVREVNKKVEELIEENAKRIEEVRKESSKKMEKTIAENEEIAERLRAENDERLRKEIVKKVCHLIENSGS